MEQTHLVSVIVPAYNAEQTVEKCIESLLRQSWRNIEVLAVDDGSTDRTAEIVRRLGERDGRVLLLQQKNGGTSAARNLGLSRATGEYLLFVDADDYVDSDYIERLVQRAVSTGADLVLCGLTCVDPDGRVLKRIVPDYYERGRHEEWTFRISAACSHLYRRELWERYHVRFTTGERGEDMPIALFFSAVCQKIEVLPCAGYRYVQHQDSAMGNFRGLKTWKLPLSSLEYAIVKANEVGIADDRECFELFIMRILCTCFFDLARGADREKLRELAGYCVRIVETYCPDYRRNRKMNLISCLDLPVQQKLAVSLLRFLIRTRAIYPAADILHVL